MLENEKSLYVTDSSGDSFLVEIREEYGYVSLNIGDSFRIDMNPDEAFDIVDALTMVANDVTSHTGES